MSLKFLSPPRTRADVSQPYRQGVPRAAVEAPLTPAQLSALESYQTRAVTILRAGAVRVLCCSPTPEHKSAPAGSSFARR